MKIIAWKTLLTTLIGTGIAGSLATMPVKAGNDLVKSSTSSELTLSQVNESDYQISQRYRPNNPESWDNFQNVVGLTGLAIGTGVIGYYVTRAYKPSLANSIPAGNSTGSLLDRINPKLRKELLRLVHNKATASRLLTGTLTSHPGRSPNWVAEKVIYDLKRDR